MSGLNEVTISPVLLQAISQTLTSTKDRHTVSMQPNINVKQEMMDDLHMSGGHSVTHLLQGMNEPVSEPLRLHSRSVSSDMENPPESPVQDFSPSNINISSENIKSMLKWKIDQLHQQNALNSAVQHVQDEARQEPESTPNRETIIITSNAGTDLSMVNVLSAIASHHLKTGGAEKDPGDNSPVDDVNQTSTISMSSSEEPEPIATEQEKQMIICYPDNNGQVTVPSPVNDVVVSDSSGLPVGVVIEQDGQRYYMPHVDKSSGLGLDTMPGVKQFRYAEDGSIQMLTENTSVDVLSSTSREQVPLPNLGPCPICGDGISGYHYGIFTCESCKGFFKRTVQNKKTFTCHRKGDCEITRMSRKKCPACRFAKCIIHGMKLEAIRIDRMRGGRSSYDGCSPHGRPKIYPLEMMGQSSTPKTPKRTPSVHRKPSANNSNSPFENVNVTLPSGENISGSQLMAILNRNGKSVTEETVKPFVPHLLTEIMNVESYLCEDENQTDFPPERLSENDPAFMLSLLQLAELRLYKLVRWARNLPQFSSIATDDQILLLQNCWADLLLFNCCMRSIQSTTEIFLPMGKSIDMEKASKLGHGADDIVSRLLAITDQLRRLQVDQYEFVALKVLMLITPDVKALKEPGKAQEHQDLICEALELYTNSHYPQHSNKFGEMLLRLPEISRVSMIGKEILNTVMPPEFTSCGLLFELLKGDGLKDDT